MSTNTTSKLTEKTEADEAYSRARHIRTIGTVTLREFCAGIAAASSDALSTDLISHYRAVRTSGSRPKRTSMSSKKFEVQTRFTYGWENCWTEEGNDGTERPQYYDSVEEATQAIDEFFDDLERAVMAEGYSREDYRVREVLVRGS